MVYRCPLSLAHLSDLLSIPLDCADLFEEAKALGVYDDFFDLVAEAGYPPPRRPLDPAKAVEVYDHCFYTVMNTGELVPPPPPRLVAWWEPFLLHRPSIPSPERIAEVIDTQWERLNPMGKVERERLQCQLLEKGCPSETMRRVKELCLLVEVVILVQGDGWDFWMQARRLVLPTKRRLRLLLRQLRAAPLSEDTKRRACQEVDVLVKLLDAYFPSEESLRFRNKELGIDKRMTLPARKQRIWSLVFPELVHLLKPYSPNEEQVFKTIARLMYLAHPTLWPDPNRLDLVKSRYYATL